jgi:dihydroorotase
MFRGGLRPHLYCLPVLKRERDREALLEAATSGNPKFFLGTDSAPHARHLKEHSCGCAGVFSAHAGIELYAEAFDSVDRLDRLEGFASHFGADWYGLPRNATSLTLRRRDHAVPSSFPFPEGELVPYRAGGTLAWEIVDGGCA